MEEQRGSAPTEPPFWAAAWPGGQALARYVLDHPELVAGRSVLDLGSGSGLVAVAAALAGAARVVASEIDPFGATAIAVNAELNGVPPIEVVGDVLGDEPARRGRRPGRRRLLRPRHDRAGAAVPRRGAGARRRGAPRRPRPAVRARATGWRRWRPSTSRTPSGPRRSAGRRSGGCPDARRDDASRRRIPLRDCHDSITAVTLARVRPVVTSPPGSPRRTPPSRLAPIDAGEPGTHRSTGVNPAVEPGSRRVGLLPARIRQLTR